MKIQARKTRYTLLRQCHAGQVSIPRSIASMPTKGLMLKSFFIYNIATFHTCDCTAVVFTWFLVDSNSSRYKNIFSISISFHWWIGAGKNQIFPLFSLVVFWFKIQTLRLIVLTYTNFVWYRGWSHVVKWIGVFCLSPRPIGLNGVSSAKIPVWHGVTINSVSLSFGCVLSTYDVVTRSR